ncbi:MAG: hypothetical protein IGS50_06025 [Synechococcales cyanobacterium C42_A2020_086]|nr:hypothetical protein [Synechococcales cyanobacterium C42_A2020_086]
MLYQLVHSVVGRCRMRVPRLATDPEFATTLHHQITTLEFVIEARINPAASSLVVCYDSEQLHQDTLLDHVGTCIQQVATTVRLDSLAISTTHSQTGSGAEKRQDNDQDEDEGDLIPLENRWQDLGMPVLSLSMALLAAPLELPPLLVGVAVAGAAMPWFTRAIDSLTTHHHPNIDLLDSAWMTVQTLRGQYIAPALKTVLVELRRTLRGNTTETTTQTARALLTALRQPVRLLQEGQWVVMPATALQAGDCIVVQAGETIPVDGQILAGTGWIDCQHLTGVAEPLNCTVGHSVYALSRLVDGEIWIQVQRVGEQTRIGLAAQLMQSTPVHDTRIGAHQAELVKQAIVPTLLLGGAVFVATGNLGAAISPYQLDFGSGIPITISTTLLAALTHAVRNGVYIRGGRALEALAETDVVVFDQQTLTPDSPEWTEVITTLQDQGITVYLLSHTAVPTAVAEQFGIPAEQILSEAPLSQQQHLIEGLRSQGKTVVVVEPATTASDQHLVADVTVTAAASDLSHGDVVLFETDLRGLPYAIAIAKRAMSVLYQNTALIVVPNLIMQIGGGMIVGVHPVYNVIVNNGSALLAEFLVGTHPHFDSITPIPAAPKRTALLSGSAAVSPNSLSIAARSQTAEPASKVMSEVNGHAATNDLHPEKQDERHHSQPGYRLYLKQLDLAKRVGLTSQALTRQRSKPNFSDWIKARDPEGKSWCYDPTAKVFFAV